MARRGNNHNGINIGTTIMCLFLICALAALMVTSGAWDKIARTIPGLNQTGTSIEAIKPQGDAHDKLGLALPAPTPAARHHDPTHTEHQRPARRSSKPDQHR